MLNKTGMKSSRSIINKCKKLNIDYSHIQGAYNNIDSITEQQEKDIIQKYQNGQSATLIGKEYHLFSSSITNILIRNGLYVRSKKESLYQTVYMVDKDTLKIIEKFDAINHCPGNVKIIARILRGLRKDLIYNGYMWIYKRSVPDLDIGDIVPLEKFPEYIRYKK